MAPWSAVAWRSMVVRKTFAYFWKILITSLFTRGLRERLKLR